MKQCITNETANKCSKQCIMNYECMYDGTDFDLKQNVYLAASSHNYNSSTA